MFCGSAAIPVDYSVLPLVSSRELAETATKLSWAVMPTLGGWREEISFPSPQLNEAALPCCLSMISPLF